MRLDIPSGTSVRFEPGEEKTVTLVEIGGRKTVRGLNGMADTYMDERGKRRRCQILKSRMDGGGDPMKMSREQYAELFGPTTGDKVRLGDTDLWIEVEKDFTNYGEEMIFGGGKTIRDGMGQNGRITGKDGALDLVITNAVILDYTGIVKADIGVKDGRIVGVGKSGNPDMMDGVDPHMIIGAGTEVISGEGKIVTA